jgi:hypothetical protein
MVVAADVRKYESATLVIGQQLEARMLGSGVQDQDTVISISAPPPPLEPTSHYVTLCCGGQAVHLSRTWSRPTRTHSNRLSGLAVIASRQYS